MCEKKHPFFSDMKLIFLTLLVIIGITDSRSEQYEAVEPADTVFALAGEDVFLPCSVKPYISVVDMRVEWFRPDLKNALVYLYEDHDDRNTNQSQSYRGRTKLNHQELQRGNASLKLSSVQVSDEGRYKCLIQSKSWSVNATVIVRVEAVAGSPPVIIVDGFDQSGGLRLQCESEGWYPEPVLEWLDSEGVRLSSETAETHRNEDGFSVKHTLTVYETDSKIHCRVKLRHHMLETMIIATSNMFDLWRTSVILISVAVVLSVNAGILIAVFTKNNRKFDQRLQNQKMIILQEITHLRTHTGDVILDADTAHPHLIVSRDGKQVSYGNTQLEGVNGKRFNDYLGVLGKDGFSSGCFYYEVQTKGQTEWDLGVARASVYWMGLTVVSPMIGYWTVSLRDGECWARKSPHVSLPLNVNPQRVGVFVDYEKGLVSFYDVEGMSLMYSYTNQSFDEKLYPFVSLGYLRNENSTPLIICDDYF
ncbi:butyrophilin subfamily 1 member A1-like isoform X2 [Cyprinus carpio]|uniref:Butyrophilin subfamily 1 member A1-like isoform X2 n=1 Tax=Cyprinus carpio TaxID=7962 RepID=A0A9Q9ZDQ5_CYPCA|nr:butyrophilin subfamily 1 member A1-like isoform X2 [Cyprinus carpio]